MKLQAVNGSPVQPGKTVVVFPLEAREAETYEATFSVDSAGLLFSIWVDSIVGNLDIEVVTQAQDGQEQVILTVPTITAATTSLQIEPVRADFLSVIKVRVTTDGPSTWEIRARAVPSNLGELGNQGCHRILDEIVVEDGAELLVLDGACVAVVVTIANNHYLRIPPGSVSEFN